MHSNTVFDAKHLVSRRTNNVEVKHDQKHWYSQPAIQGKHGNASTIAGLEVLRIIDDPTATTIAYGLDQKKDETQVIIYELGGGTFNVFLLSTDFDNYVINYLTEWYKEKTSTNVSQNLKTLSKLKCEVEKPKYTLFSQQATRNHFSETLTCTKFKELNMDFFCKTMKPVKQVLKDVTVKQNEIDKIVLVGGSTCIPKVQQLLKDFFSRQYKT